MDLYKLVESGEYDIFEDLLNEAAEEGYAPTGNLIYSSNHKYIQLVAHVSSLQTWAQTNA